MPNPVKSFTYITKTTRISFPSSKAFPNSFEQRVVIESTHSKWRTIKAGVPQRSILEPLFFIIFINDIVTEIQSSIQLFADDTSLYVIVDNPRESAITLKT
jgi:hypothetical protein